MFRKKSRSRERSYSIDKKIKDLERREIKRFESDIYTRNKEREKNRDIREKEKFDKSSEKYKNEKRRKSRSRSRTRSRERKDRYYKK